MIWNTTVDYTLVDEANKSSFPPVVGQWSSFSRYFLEIQYLKGFWDALKTGYPYAWDSQAKWFEYSIILSFLDSHLSKHSTVLEIGPGFSFFPVLLERRFGVYTLDDLKRYHPDFDDSLRVFYRDKFNAKYVIWTGYIEDFHFPDIQVDAIVLVCVLEHITEDIAAFQNMLSILKPGGFICSTVEMSGDDPLKAGPYTYDSIDRRAMIYNEQILRDRYELPFKLTRVGETDYTPRSCHLNPPNHTTIASWFAQYHGQP